MKRGSIRFIVLTVLGAAIWGGLLFASSGNNVKVTGLERQMNKVQTDLQERDCYITGLDRNNKPVSGYAPSSFCSSVSVGDTVVIKDGIVTRK